MSKNLNNSSNKSSSVDSTLLKNDPTTDSSSLNSKEIPTNDQTLDSEAISPLPISEGGTNTQIINPGVVTSDGMMLTSTPALPMGQGGTNTQNIDPGVVTSDGSTLQSTGLGMPGQFLSSDGISPIWTTSSGSNNEAKYIIQEEDASLPNAQSLRSISSGVVLNTSDGTTGILSSTGYGTVNQVLRMKTQLTNRSIIALVGTVGIAEIKAIDVINNKITFLSTSGNQINWAIINKSAFIENRGAVLNNNGTATVSTLKITNNAIIVATSAQGPVKTTSIDSQQHHFTLKGENDAHVNWAIINPSVFFDSGNTSTDADGLKTVNTTIVNQNSIVVVTGITGSVQVSFVTEGAFSVTGDANTSFNWSILDSSIFLASGQATAKADGSYVLQTQNEDLPNSQALEDLNSGIVTVDNTTGVLKSLGYGAADQVLISSGSEAIWKDLNVPSIDAPYILKKQPADQTFPSAQILTDVTNSGVVTVDKQTGELQSAGYGTQGQIFSSTGSGVTWSNPQIYYGYLIPKNPNPSHDNYGDDTGFVFKDQYFVDLINQGENDHSLIMAYRYDTRQSHGNGQGLTYRQLRVDESALVPEQFCAVYNRNDSGSADGGYTYLTLPIFSAKVHDLYNQNHQMSLTSSVYLRTQGNLMNIASGYIVPIIVQHINIPYPES